MKVKRFLSKISSAEKWYSISIPRMEPQDVRWKQRSSANCMNSSKNENTVIIGISMDSVESHRKFKMENNIPFILLSDPEGRVLKRYDVLEEPVNKEAPYRSVVRTTFLINEDGKIVKIYSKVNPKGHAETCLLDVKSIKA